MKHPICTASTRRRVTGRLLAALLLSLAACAEDNSTTGQGAPDGAGDASLLDALTDAVADTTTPPDVPATPDAASTPDTEPRADVALAGFGDPCVTWKDCQDARCIPTPAGKVCTRSCVDDCPAGWGCHMDEQLAGFASVDFICVPLFGNLCRPCIDDGDCALYSIDHGDTLCIDRGDAGRFCGSPCDVDDTCPKDTECADVPGPDGGTARQCLPTSGECTCNAAATADGAATVCHQTNEHGSCAGVRTCEAAGLTACDAGTAATETCNGKDDDCDGQTDEDVPATPCKVKSPFGECPGTVVCTAGKTACAGTEAVEEACNGADDDCDGETDEGFPDTDGDGVADCMEVDTDGDGVEDPDDNCPELWNPEQEDADDDGQGDVCDPDDDDDGSPDDEDCAPFDPALHPGAAEACNGIDDDCDAQIDENFPGLGDPCDGPDDDQCASGTLTCTPDGAGIACVGDDGGAGKPELCNGKDDDCDGLIDELFPTLGDPCDGPDGDLCAHGTTICGASGEGTTCGPEALEDVAEACNGSDDDCDGAIDEDWPTLGQACDGPDEDSCLNGSFACAPGGAGVVCTGEVAPSDELCDGKDNDCDGKVDEDWPLLGLPCDGPDADKCKNGMVVCGAGGAGTVCSAEFPADLVEVCNGKDDDCNGVTDEGFDGLGAPCDGPDTDLCENGVLTCSADGTAVVCGVETPAGVVELCNGADDDCDGDVDEGFDGLGDPCDGDDTDLCTNGLVVCAEDGASVVCGAEDPADVVELCNGADDDCDGKVDEGFDGLGAACDGPDADDCKNGVFTCTDDGAGVACTGETGPGAAEICDGKDNDCDGDVDEGFDGLGAPCDGPDDDVCEDGVQACAADGASVACLEAGTGHLELCNGADDDCDGDVDEGYAGLGDACDGPDNDQCKNGVQVCAASGLGVVCGAETVSDVPELCNGADDDCDGAVDEGYTGLGLPCDGPDGDLCKNGLWSCTSDGLGTTCSAEEPAGLVELCNGVDDDCDGDVDEEWPTLGEACDGPDTDACANGVVTCTADGGAAACGPEEPASIPELCNGADDDCDGEVDEGFAGVGQPCDGPDFDLCKNGVGACAADGSSVVCPSEAVVDLVEACNGADDDCDGLVDEDFLTLGDACDGPDTDVCLDGTWTCTADGADVECTGEGGSTVEVCDGKDNDCDGTVDEGCTPTRVMSTFGGAGLVGTFTATDGDGTARAGAGLPVISTSAPLPGAKFDVRLGLYATTTGP